MTDTIKTEDLRAIVERYKDSPRSPNELLWEIQGLLPDETMKDKDWNYDDHFLAEVRLSTGWGSEFAVMLGRDHVNDSIQCIIKGDNSIFYIPPQELTPTGRKAKLVIDTGLMVDRDDDLWEEINGHWVLGSSPEIRKERAAMGAGVGDPAKYNARPYTEEF